MAFFDTTGRDATLFQPIAALRGLLDTPFDTRARAIRARTAELRSMSDEELSRLGIARRDILRHALLTAGR